MASGSAARDDYGRLTVARKDWGPTVMSTRNPASVPRRCAGDVSSAVGIDDATGPMPCSVFNPSTT